MELDPDKFRMAVELAQHCLLPEFDRDIGDQPLERDDFNVFVYGLNESLRLLFDIVAKNDQFLFKINEETETFRTNFILLLNEQSGYDDAPFQTDDQFLLQHIRKLVDKYYQNILRDKRIFDKCLDFYKSRLTVSKWKRNIGAVYGYGRLCELHFAQFGAKLSSDDSLFMLSVGMILVDYFEEQYKCFGLKLFKILMQTGDERALSEQNIFGAIYDKLMNPLVVVVKEESTISMLLACLYKCIEHDSGWKEPSEWNKVDDVLEAIAKRVAFENDSRCVARYFLFIAQLTTLPIKENLIVQAAVNADKLDSSSEQAELVNYTQLREICQIHDNLLVYRWTKKLFELYKHQTFLGQSSDIRLHLHAVHVNYLCCIYGISLKLLNIKWIDFVEHFVPRLIELIKSNHQDEQIKQETKEFWQTLSSHISNSVHELDERLLENVSSISKSLEQLQNVLSIETK